MGEPCNCKSDVRRIAIVAKNALELYPEIGKFAADNGWHLWIDGDTFALDVGSGQKFEGLSDLVNFLKAVLDEKRFEDLRVSWIERDQSIQSQAARLIHAQPISSVESTESSQLSGILRNKLLETWYQPVVTESGAIWAYECLMRARKERGEPIMPERLLTWARAEKLTFMLDRICRETHVQNAAAAGLPSDMMLLINFLPSAIYQPLFCLKSTLAAVSESGISPQQIMFEVVDADSIQDRDHLRSILHFYQDAGFKVALDDVGASQANFALFADLKADYIKLDKSLVARAAETDFHKGQCSALIIAAKDRNQKVIAKGIETETQFKVMKELGVDYFQGFLFAKPAPAMMKTVATITP